MVISQTFGRYAALNKPAAFISKCQVGLSPRFANAASISKNPQVPVTNAFRPVAANRNSALTTANLNRAPAQRTAIPTLRAA